MKKLLLCLAAVIALASCGKKDVTDRKMGYVYGWAAWDATKALNGEMSNIGALKAKELFGDATQNIVISADNKKLRAFVDETMKGPNKALKGTYISHYALADYLAQNSTCYVNAADQACINEWKGLVNDPKVRTQILKSAKQQAQ